MEANCQLVHVYVFTLLLNGIHAIYPLLSQQDKNSWNQLFLKCQKHALGAVPNTQTSIVSKISKIPSLEEFKSFQLLKECFFIFKRGCRDNLAAKINILEPDSESRINTFFKIENKFPKKSGLSKLFSQQSIIICRTSVTLIFLDFS